jgi:Ca-activated chloride channel family protein
MPDFAAGQTERVVARVTVSGSAVGQTVNVTGLKLAYTDLMKDGAVESAASLSAMVTDRREENRDSLSHRDHWVSAGRECPKSGGM